jgi:hypothetical protein
MIVLAPWRQRLVFRAHIVGTVKSDPWPTTLSAITAIVVRSQLRFGSESVLKAIRL